MEAKRWLSSRRLAAVGLPLLALLSTTAMSPAASVALAPRLLAQRVNCPAGTIAQSDALRLAGAAPSCQAASKPETFADLASLNHQLQAREAAPFSKVAPGAYQAAVAQKAAVLPAGTYSQSGGSWQPAGASPLCDGHTTQSNLCPLLNNTSSTDSNGDYTISSLGHKTLSGRATSFAGDPANSNHLWISAAGGGIFETKDAGTTWTSVGDGLVTQVVGAIAYDAPLHTLLVGTGDNSFGGDGIEGHGVFYSTDDGGHWASGAGVPDGSLTFRLVVSPADASGQTIYAALSRGLYKSTDGGHSYTNLNLPTSPAGYTVPDPLQGNHQVSCTGNVTTPLCFFANIVTDVVVKGTGSTNAPAGAVMAVVGWRAGQRIDLKSDGTTQNTDCLLTGAATPCLQSPQNGVYVSTSGAANSFTFQSVPSASAAGLSFAPNNVVGRTSLGIAYGPGQNNDAVFALVQDAVKFQGCVDDPTDTSVTIACQSTVQALGYGTVLDGAYASYDFGKTWTKIMVWNQLINGGNSALVGLPGYNPGVQSWYNNWIQPDPTATDSSGNPTRVIFGLEEIWENNMNIPTVLNQPYLLPTNQGRGAASPWIVIGRYWNDCGGLNLTGGIVCNPTTQSNPVPGTTTHPDQHADLFVPDASGGGVTLYAGNDGGAYKQHVASGADFSNDNWGDGINTGLYTLQPYDAEIAKDGTIVAGLQDNGEMKIAPGGKENHTVFGGDGFWSAIDPNSSQNILEEYAYGAISLSINGGKDWYNIDPACGSDNSQFSTAFEQDPTTPGHVVDGCTNIQEATNIYTNPCAAPPGASPFQCQLSNVPWTSVYDLGTVANPGQPRPTQCTNGNTQDQCDPYNIPSAVGVQAENVYVGYCGYCDIVTGKQPFNSGVATNVGGSSPPSIGTGNGWHIAGALCAGCGTANGKLPKRFINSIQMDPHNPRTVYVTLGGYGRRWIPPG
ncbi:MAG TPA: hypothetical protein VG245_11285, partial [Candidatus Dormibacteraeota bacterium]|nr:hypothetical protein [Candidatus Dormibacteraeota bacterium]